MLKREMEASVCSKDYVTRGSEFKVASTRAPAGERVDVVSICSDASKSPLLRATASTTRSRSNPIASSCRVAPSRLATLSGEALAALVALVALQPRTEPPSLRGEPGTGSSEVRQCALPVLPLLPALFLLPLPLLPLPPLPALPLLPLPLLLLLLPLLLLLLLLLLLPLLLLPLLPLPALPLPVPSPLPALAALRGLPPRSGPTHSRGSCEKPRAGSACAEPCLAARLCSAGRLRHMVALAQRSARRMRRCAAAAHRREAATAKMTE